MTRLLQTMDDTTSSNSNSGSGPEFVFTYAKMSCGPDPEFELELALRPRISKRLLHAGCEIAHRDFAPCAARRLLADRDVIDVVAVGDVGFVAMARARLDERVFDLERRARAAIAAREGTPASSDEWVGIGFRLGAERFVTSREPTRMKVTAMLTGRSVSSCAATVVVM